MNAMQEVKLMELDETMSAISLKSLEKLIGQLNSISAFGSYIRPAINLKVLGNYMHEAFAVWDDGINAE